MIGSPIYTPGKCKPMKENCSASDLKEKRCVSVYEGTHPTFILLDFDTWILSRALEIELVVFAYSSKRKKKGLMMIFFKRLNP